MRYSVYKITNNLNGKVYVGFTSKPLMKRWNDHVNYMKHVNRQTLHVAMNKHGVHNFKIELLERMSTELGAKRAEMLWIKELNSFGPGGYNMTAGGEGTLGYRHTSASKNKMSRIHKGKTISDELKSKWSLQRAGQLNPMFGRKRSAHTRDLIGEKNGIKIIGVSPGGETVVFRSILDASNRLSVSRYHISKSLKTNECVDGWFFKEKELN